MLEFVFKDMEYVRVMDAILDQHEEYDVFEMEKELFIPSIKIQTIMEDYEKLGIIKRKSKEDGLVFVIQEKSGIFENLNKVDLEACSMKEEELCGKTNE